MSSHASTAVIRQWAREQGIAIGDRGRLAPAVLADKDQRVQMRAQGLQRIQKY